MFLADASADSGVNCNYLNLHTQPILQDRRHHTVLIKIKRNYTKVYWSDFYQFGFTSIDLEMQKGNGILLISGVLLLVPGSRRVMIALPAPSGLVISMAVNGVIQPY